MTRFRGLTFFPCSVLSLALLGGCSSADTAAPKARDPFTIDKNVTPPVLHMEPDAVRRLELRTEPVTANVALRNRPGSGVGIPYSGLLYMPDGTTFVYLQIAENTFQHQVVTVDHVAGAVVALAAGPALGARVVTAGAAELSGSEYGVGK